jgi:hypothetical protein
MEIIVSVMGIVVAVAGTIVRIIVVRTYTRIVVIPGSCPVMSVRPIDVAPVIPVGKGMNAHVVIGVEIDVGDVVARITNKHITTIVNDVKIIRIRRIQMGMRSLNIAPVCISVDIVYRMGSII